MIAAELLESGSLEASLTQLQDEVRRHPADAKSRVFLFQLLCVVGQWERASTQLQVIGELDAGALPMVLTYRGAAQCELLREKVFAGQSSPIVLGEPQRWVALIIEALRVEGRGAYAEAQQLREEAFAAAPASAGTLGGEPFAWIADADSRLGPILEVVIWTNGGTAVGLIPTRYVGSAAADDPICLARRTEWQERAPGLYHGLGQRMFATDRGEYPLLEVREIILAPVDDPGGGGDVPAADG